MMMTADETMRTEVTSLTTIIMTLATMATTSSMTMATKETTATTTSEEWSSGESVIYDADFQYKSLILCAFHVSLELEVSAGPWGEERLRTQLWTQRESMILVSMRARGGSYM